MTIKNRLPFIIAFCALLLILLAQRQALGDLLTAWGTEEYSHGPLIPFIAAWLGWHLLAAEKPALRPSWRGIAWLAVAGLLQLVSSLSAFGMTAEYGLIAALIGICLCCCGRAAAKILAPVFVYLAFAVPLPHLAQADLSENLQLISSTLGVWPLDAMGIPVFQEGNVIDLGGYKLQVVDACSGLRYLFPLMSFGYLVAFLLQDRWWKRAVVFLSTIPIGIILNSLRITFIGITVDLWGAGMAAGFIHSFEGWAVFLLCLLILLIETWALLRIKTGGGTVGKFRFDYLAMPHGPLFGERLTRQGPVWACLAFAAALALVFGSGRIGQGSEIIPPHPPLVGFPVNLGPWQGQQDHLPPDVLQALQRSAYWLADYHATPNEPPVNFYIAYYASQRVGTTTHSPANCIPGGGWRIEHSDAQTVTPPGQPPLRLTRMLIRKDHDAALVYYWFDERGRDLTETTAAKWYLLRDSIVMRRSDGALVRLVTPLGPHENVDMAAARLDGFLGFALPPLRLFIPGAGSINNIAKP